MWHDTPWADNGERTSECRNLTHNDRCVLVVLPCLPYASIQMKFGVAYAETETETENPCRGCLVHQQYTEYLLFMCL